VKPESLVKSLMLVVAAAFCWIGLQPAVAQERNLMGSSLTEFGYVPLPDLGMGSYTRDGHAEPAGLYLQGWSTRPPDFEATVLEIARKQIQPLDAQGNPDPKRDESRLGTRPVLTSDRHCAWASRGSRSRPDRGKQACGTGEIRRAGGVPARRAAIGLLEPVRPAFHHGGVRHSGSLRVSRFPCREQDSGSRWCATPFLCGSFIRDSLPALTGAFMVSTENPEEGGSVK
jgi:hypothetical protein